MMWDNDLCTSSQKWIKTKTKTFICFNNKGNEVIAWCSLNVWSCIFLSRHRHCMWCHHWCSLHHICASWVSNDNVHQNSKARFGDNDIHSSLDVMREKVRNLPLNMWSIFQSNTCNNISKCVMGWCTFIPTRTPK
jgi:hypothetical protein